MNSPTLHLFAVSLALLAAAGCEQRNPMAVSPAAPTSSTAQTVADAGMRFGVNGGAGLREALSGAAINGIVPEGQALADESQYASGGSTMLTVQIKNVNLPDGTVLGVTLDFQSIGTITVRRREGTLTASLGHFGVSNDQVRVTSGATTILAGSFFN